MASVKKGQRKRKSAGLGDIFEISDKDLSPEPEEINPDEPKAKVLKTRDSDVSESRANEEQHNPDNEEQTITGNKEVITKSVEEETDSQQKTDCIDISDTSVSEIDDVVLVEEQNAVIKDPSQAPQTSYSGKDPSAEVQNKNEKSLVIIIRNDISNAAEKKANDSANDACTSISVEKSEEIFTIVDDDQEESVDDVIICDSSTDLTKVVIPLPSPQITSENTLEDGELNEATFEEPDARVIEPIPAITINFSDKSMAELYKLKFLKFIQAFAELEVHNVDDATTISVFRDEHLDLKEWVIVDGTDSVANKKEEELAKLLPVTPKPDIIKKKKKKRKQAQQRETELFVVDAKPGADAHKPILTKYSTKFLINEKNQEDKNVISKPSSSNVCFNCDKEHSLRDCPHPKNYAKISASRQKHQIKNKSSRYHLEEDQKYSHLKPGKISPGLRKALGLRKHQIPSYVYQMRLLGYPPGWLEEAKFVGSELTMFDIDGNNVKDTNSNKNEGLDPEKVVEFPGFNAPYENEKDFKDEYKYHRVPPFCDKYNKQNMIENFKKFSHREKDDFETQDMELDNTNDSVENEEVSDKCKLESKQLDFNTDSDSNNTASISLKDLQLQKDSLLEEIKKSGETIPWEQPSEDSKQSGSDKSKNTEEEESCTKNEASSEDQIIDEESVENRTAKEKPDVTETPSKPDVTETPSKPDVTETPSKDNNNENCPQLSTPKNVNSVKCSEFGTPILKTNSPYNRLPNADNFMKGVSPVIDFENLPNSTGKYEQMTGVLQKVRTTLKRLNQPNT